MMPSIKTPFHGHIATVKFASQVKGSPCSLVVTFLSFGSEGHGVQPPKGDYAYFLPISIAFNFSLFV